MLAVMRKGSNELIVIRVPPAAPPGEGEKGIRVDPGQSSYRRLRHR